MIKLIDVFKSFPNLNLFRNINLEIYKDEITFIVGASGSGKTTLLNLLGGLDSIDQGKILLDGVDICTNIDFYRSNDVAFVFQDYNLISGLSIKQNVQLALLYSNKKVDDHEITEQLKMLGLNNENQKIETLSGGEKQRVTISRAILKDSSLILADEPTGNLDSKNADNVFELLKKLKMNRHVIVVTHDLDKAKEYADRIITLKDGSIFSDVRITPKSNANNKRKNISKQNKCKNYFKDAWLLGKNSIKKNVVRILSISLALSIAITALVMMADLNIFGNKISNNVNINYLETDLLTLYYDRTPNVGHSELPFEINDLDSIMKRYNGKEIIDIYYNDFNSLQFSYGYKTSKATIKQVKINNFFKERLISSEINGQFLENDNDVILAIDVANAILGDDFINKVIQLNNGNGQYIELRVVGVNTIVNPNNEIYSYISNNIVKKLYSKFLSDSLFTTPLQINKIKTERTSVSIGGIKPSFNTFNGDEELLYGRFPENKNEIILGHKELIRTLQMLDLQFDFSEQEVLDKSIPLEVIDSLLNHDVCFFYNDYYEVKIVGVYNFSSEEVKLTQELIEDMQVPKPKKVELYIKDVEKIEQTMDIIKENEDFVVNSSFQNLKDNISSQTNFFELALFALGIILILIALVMLNSFTKITILERKEEIAIIKSLGASRRNIINVIFFDFLIIFLFSFVLASVFLIAYVIIFPMLLSNISYINLTYPWVMLLIVGGCFLFFLFFYCLIGLRKLIKTMPVVLFKQI